MIHQSPRCQGPGNRREFLKIGTLGLAGLSLADVLRMKSEAADSPIDDETSVIFVWLPGGPSHMETFDMKPDAPADYRGAFRPIRTNVSGIEICELMPELAKVADRYNIIRSVAHGFSDHGGGHKRFMTARKPATPTGFVNDAPAVGSLVSKWFENRDVGIPNYICNAPNGRHGVDVFSMGSAWLGPSYNPFTVPGNPADEGFQLRDVALSNEMEDRLDDRKTLLTQLDNLRSRLDQSGMMDAIDGYQHKAMNLLVGKKLRNAFDLSQEDDKLRDEYGRHCWGQRALLARRLAEAGAKFITMVMENPYKSGVTKIKNGTYNWDSHAVNCHMFDDLTIRLPILDRAIATLIRDITDRGLDKKVLLIVTGEFGRTPRISHNVGSQTGVQQPGRDHWPGAMSMLVAGGGMQTGQVIGSTNAKGEHPLDRPLTPNDLWATVFRHIGVDPDHAWPNHAGRPMPLLPFGKPIDF